MVRCYWKPILIDRIVPGKQLFVLVLLLAGELVQAQNPMLNKYKPGEGLVFTGSSGYSTKINGYVQPMFETKTISSDTSSELYNRFRMRRIRLRFSGESPDHKVDYRVQLDLSGTSESGEEAGALLMDAWVSYNPTRRLSIRFGQSTDPTDNRELTMGSHTLQLVERSRVTSAFSSIRAIGMFASHTWAMGNSNYLKSYFTINNGDGLNTYQADHGKYKIGGRIDYLPFGLFTYYGQFRQVDIIRELAPKLVFGAAYSRNYGMSSRRGRVSGSILYLDEELQESLPDYDKLGIDFLFKYRGFSMLGEYVATSASVPDNIVWRVRNDGTISNSFDVNGVQDVDNYVKSRMMLGKGYNLQAGYILKSGWSFDARYAHLKADANSFLNNGTFYARPKYYTFGVSHYFNRNYNFKIQSSLTWVELAPGANDTDLNPISGHELIGRLITSFAF